MKCRKLSAEHKRKIGLANKGKNNGMYGRKGAFDHINKNPDHVVWNKGLTKEIHPSIKSTSDKMKGINTWQLMDKDKVEDRKRKLVEKWKDPEYREKQAESHKGKISWNSLDEKGLIKAKEKCRELMIKTKSRYGDFRPARGKYEESVLKNIEECFGYKIIRQKYVGGYFLDGYCPALNLAIEIDEPKHKKESQLIKDAERENYIKEKIGCQFLRINIPV